jgi:hypothetical protein
MVKPRLLNREQASAYLLEVWGIKRTPKTLQTFVTRPGRGPDYVKVGGVARYAPDALDKWVESITRPPKKQPWSGVAPSHSAGA